MVKMKAYFKDSRRMFKNNLFRYVSIILIIMLGTTFFIGMNSVAPEMKRTAAEYMENNHVFDVSLMSNMGYNEEDIDKFKEIEHIDNAQGIHLYDVLAESGETDIAVRMSSISDNSNINKNEIVDGRDIKNSNECLISTRLNEMYNYDIGDKIKVYLKDDTKLEDYINTTEFEIVGVTKTPIYLSKFYGNTTLLTGELNGYIMVKEDVFEMEKYTTVYVKTNIDSNLDKFSDEYKEELDKILPNLEKLNTEISNDKFNQEHQSASNKISDYENKIKSAEDYLSNVNEQIKNSQLQINEGIVNISSEASIYHNTPNMYKAFSEKNKNILSIYSEIEEKNNQINILQSEYDEIKLKKESYKNELQLLENGIDKNLYEIYSLEDEESRFVELNKEINQMYYKYNPKKEEYKNIEQQYQNKEQELNNAKEDIRNLKERLNNEQNGLYALFEKLESFLNNKGNLVFSGAIKQIKDGKSQLEESKEKLANQNPDKKINEAKEKVNEQKNELNQFKVVTEETPLYKNSGFKSLKDDLSKIAIMGRIFPVMFFVVAALVTITTITRMIEEDRKNIGTLKALGYSKKKIMSRYIIYSLSAALIGTLLGTLLGSTLIVQILFVSYSSLYDLPDLVTHINVLYTGIALAISLISTVAVTLIITSKELKENAATLMRPKSAKEGKNILLERMPIVWNKMDFLFKVCFRNIFRYKRRLFMTLVGIAGCTALIYAGLGLQSAIDEIGEKQFRDVRKLSMEVYMQKEMKGEEIEDVIQHIKNQDHVISATPVSQQTLTVETSDNSKDVFYIAVSGDEIDKYMGVQERKSQEKIELNNDGVVLTEKLANVLETKVGDRIKIIDGSTNATVKVIGITENYLYNYIYLTPKVYERIYGKEITYNEVFVNIDKELTESEELEIIDKIKENDKVASCVLESSLNKEFQTSLGSLMAIVFLFVGCASLLSFTVLINLNNINFEERKRELATIKLLGFRKKELQSYLFRENIILTILGTIVGLLLGVGILGIIIQSAEVETIFLSKDINIINMGISSVMTICFTLITNLFMKRKIKNIDMIDSLKSSY